VDHPVGLAFDSAGALYVTNSNVGFGTIEKYTQNGGESVFVRAGLDRPGYLAFTDNFGVPLPLANQRAIPEPATLALLALGLPALLGFRHPRRA
jgi:hypothetical protein